MVDILGSLSCAGSHHLFRSPADCRGLRASLGCCSSNAQRSLRLAENDDRDRFHSLRSWRVRARDENYVFSQGPPLLTSPRGRPQWRTSSGELNFHLHPTHQTQDRYSSSNELQELVIWPADMSIPRYSQPCTLCRIGIASTRDLAQQPKSFERVVLHNYIASPVLK